MPTPSVRCALLAAMVAKHRWGTPIDEEILLAIAAIDANDYPIASEVFDELRSEPSVTTRGDRGIELDNGEFGALADVLYHIDARRKPTSVLVGGIRQGSKQPTSDRNPTPQVSRRIYKEITINVKHGWGT
jgi:hypothetical protein